MSGIEKICEYPGEYPGWLMYGYKRNQLQVMPKYRALFRGASHTLTINVNEKVWCNDGLQWSYDKNEWTEYTPAFVSEKEFINWYKSKGNRLLKEYKYELKVYDKFLCGNVEGKYINWTTDISATKRKLRRILRCEKLNIINVSKK